MLLKDANLSALIENVINEYIEHKDSDNINDAVFSILSTMCHSAIRHGPH